MTPETFRTIRGKAGLSQDGLSRLLGFSGGRKSVWRLEAGEAAITGPVALIMHLIGAGKLNLVQRAAEKRDKA